MSKLAKLAGSNPVENIGNVLGSTPSEATKNNVLIKNYESMKFSCCECGGIIHGAALVVDKKFMHITCANKIEKEEEDVKLEEV